MTEDAIVGQHHQLDGQEFEQAPGAGDGQGSLACCSPWGRKESDTTEQLNNNRSALVNTGDWVREVSSDYQPVQCFQSAEDFTVVLRPGWALVNQGPWNHRALWGWTDLPLSLGPVFSQLCDPDPLRGRLQASELCPMNCRRQSADSGAQSVASPR